MKTKEKSNSWGTVHLCHQESLNLFLSKRKGKEKNLLSGRFLDNDREFERLVPLFELAVEEPVKTKKRKNKEFKLSFIH